MLLGIDHGANKEQEIEREEARKRLNNLILCDICYLDDFTCDFEKNIYKLPQNEFPKYIEIYIDRLPIIGENTKVEFNKRKNETTKYSLGLASRIAKEEIQKICDESTKAKQLKRFNRNCCIKSDSITTEYGCRKQEKYSSKKKKYKEKYKKKYKWKTRKKKFKPSKYFKKLEGKEKLCPKGKKNCRCWICSEEGHYANECPNRAKNPKQVKLLEIAYEIDPLVSPIEEKFDMSQDVLILEEFEEIDSSDRDYSETSE